MSHPNPKAALISFLFFMFLAYPGVMKAEPGESAVFLVRHAEKVADSENPELSEAGIQRSRALAQVLKDAGITQIYSTDYRRTRETARPLAELLDLPVESYDPHALEEFARSLQHNGGRLLVVGHSNTTPEMVELLGGDSVSEIDEEAEYDRLYVVTSGPGEQVTSILLRYGTRSGF